MQQKAALNGQPKEAVFGRNETGLHHFHQNHREALGQPLLESIVRKSGNRFCAATMR